MPDTFNFTFERMSPRDLPTLPECAAVQLQQQEGQEQQQQQQQGQEVLLSGGAGSRQHLQSGGVALW